MRTIRYFHGAALAGIFCFSGVLLAQSAPFNGSTSAKATFTPAGLSLPEALPDAPEPAPASGELLPANGASSNSVSSHRFILPDAHQRLKNYLASAFGPGTFIAAGISSAVDQTHSLKVGYPSDGYPGPGEHPAHGTVPEWGEGFSGYAKRYASRYGMGLVSNTTRYGLGEVLHQDVSYHKCECSGTLPRVSHALTQAFIAHTASGRAVPSIPALVAPFVGAEVGVAGWFPSRYSVSDALRGSTNLYIGLPVQNLVNEFLRR